MSKRPRRMIWQALLTCGLCCGSLLPAVEPSAETPLAAALSAWRQGDLGEASGQLTSLIAGGTTDARVWYYRGILAELQGQDGSADFRTAATVEYQTGATRLVHRALENTQGPLRARIEAIREDVRLQHSADPTAARNAVLYRDAVVLMQAGQNADAQAKLDAAIGGGTRDPRVYYIRGVLQAKAGDTDGATALFRQGLQLETSAAHVRSVNQALQDVQGDIRRLIEEQVSVSAGDQQLTRQTNQQLVLEREAQLQEQLLAASDERRRELLAEAEQLQRNREMQAAQQILADEQQAQAVAGLVAAPPMPLPETAAPAATLPPAPAPQTPAANPFGTTTPVAEAPDAAPAPVTNPFLSNVGGATAPGSAVSAGPLDFSWLAPTTEVVVYARPADLTTSRFMAPLMQLPPVQQGLEQLVQQAGFGPADIESVTYGMGDVIAQVTAAAMQGAAAGAPGAGGAGGPDPQQMARQFASNSTALSVVRTSRDIDFAAIAQSRNAEQVSHGDRTFYLIPNANPELPPTGVHAVDSRTFLFAAEPAMKAALDRGAGSAANPQFAFVSRDSHFAMAFSSPTLAVLSGSLPAPANAPPFVTQLVEAVKGRVSGLGLVLRSSADLQVQIQLNLSDPAAGTDGLAALNAGVAMLQQLYPAYKQQVPVKLQPVTDTAVSSTQARFNAPVLSLSVNVPGQLVTILQESPELLGPLAPGVGGLPGAFPGAAPGAAPGPGPANPSDAFGIPAPGTAPAPNTAPAPGALPAPAAAPAAPQINPSDAFRATPPGGGTN